jgi:GH24 family phage-related lysozyme (muramidase)
MLDMTISERASRLILDNEGLSHADWPGGASGVTIGHGYDLGYHTPQELSADWGARLPRAVVDRLRRCLGVKGDAAKALARTLTDIRIPRETADEVFRGVDLPRWINLSRATWPCYDSLPDDAQGALVSLTFNRGTAMGLKGRPSWDTRKEMRAIRDALAAWCSGGAPRLGLPGVLDVVAGEIRSMRRLWVDQGLGGLLKRRDAEAVLVDAAAAAVRSGSV